MKHKQLIDVLKSYGRISELEEIKIREKFIIKEVGKKEVLVEKNSPCNKLFFINKGLLRAYFINNMGKDITRAFAWENRFITNIISFKNFNQNNETIESVENSELLYISRNGFDELLRTSQNFKSIYIEILEEYNAFNLKRFEHLNIGNSLEKYDYFNNHFYFLQNRLTDTLLSSFLNISRKTVERLKKVIDYPFLIIIL